MLGQHNAYDRLMEERIAVTLEQRQQKSYHLMIECTLKCIGGQVSLW